MIIGMRGHDFGRMEPEPLANAIASAGFAATQLAFGKAFPQPADAYMTDEALSRIRSVFASRGIALPVMGCYVSASDADPDKLRAAEAAFARALQAGVKLGAGCVGTETTHFLFDESQRESAYARLLHFTRAAATEAERCGAIVGIEPVALHTLNTPELTARLLADVSSSHVKVILDLANLVTPASASPEAQRKLLARCLSCFGDHICVLHVKDGIFDENGKWINRPLGEGIMDWAHLLPVLREGHDDLCALREGVFPDLAAHECRVMHAWADGLSL